MRLVIIDNQKGLLTVLDKRVTVNQYKIEGELSAEDIEYVRTLPVLTLTDYDSFDWRL